MTDRKPKPLIISHLFPNSNSPVYGIFVYEQLKKLSKLCDVRVIVPTITSTSKEFRKAFLQNNISKKEMMNGLEVFFVRAFISKDCFILTTLLSILRIRRIIRRDLKDYKINLIHGHYVYPDGFIVAILGMIFKKPVFLTVHGSDINIFSHKTRLNKLLVKWILAHVSKVIVVSNALKEKVIQLGIDEKNIAMLPNGFDEVLFKPLNKNETRNKLNLAVEKQYILFVGHLVEVKNLPLLIEAFSKLERDAKDVYLILVGRGPEENKLKELVRTLKIEDQVLFVGQKEHSEIPLWINASDVLCLSSNNEGWPTIISEALACGKPVVSTNVGGISEILKHSYIGTLVKKGDLNGYVKAMNESLNKKWDIQKISSYAKQFAWGKIANALYKEYCEALHLGK
ncbi:MAG: hypothetical protein A2W23_07350 [Planctomycetes bacterium RBG_16_43_13]|nr:MAG: hypothetical protein A2W23_07350 [Planctomycetes bacterium RBG_16_43_13]